MSETAFSFFDTDDQSIQIISVYSIRESSQLIFRVIYVELWYITITEREKHGQQRSDYGGNTGSNPAEVTNIQLRGVDG